MTILILSACSSGGNNGNGEQQTTIYFGDTQGIVYANNSKLLSESIISSVDGTQIVNIKIGTDGLLYVMTSAGNAFVFQNESWYNIGGYPIGSIIGLFYRMALDRYNNVYALGMDGQVYRTSISQKSWQQINSGSNSYMLIANDKERNIYLSSRKQLYKLNPTNLTFETVGPQLPEVISPIAIYVQNGTFYISSNHDYVYKWSEPALTWGIVGNSVPGNGAATALIANPVGDVYVSSFNRTNYVSQAGTDNWVSLDTRYTPSIFGYMGNTLYSGAEVLQTYSNNIWQTLAGPGIGNTYDGYIITALGFALDKIYVGTNSGLVWQNQNGIINNLNNGQTGSLDNTPINWVAKNSLGQLYVLTGHGYVWTYLQESWQLVGNRAPGGADGQTLGYSNQIALNGNFACVNNINGFVYCLNQESNTSDWKVLGNSRPGNYGVTQGQALAIDKKNNVYAITNDARVYTSSEYATGWKIVGGESAIVESGDNLSTLSMDNFGDLYTSDLLYGSIWKLDKTQDQWIKLGANLDPGDGGISIAFDNQNQLYVAVGSRLYKFNNNKWVLVAAKLDHYISYIEFDSNNIPYVLSNSLTPNVYEIWKIDLTTNTWTNTGYSGAYGSQIINFVTN